MIKSNFREWTSDKIDETFGTYQVFESQLLDSWLSFQCEIEDSDKKTIAKLQKPLIKGSIGWNEFELENKFISPIFMLAELDGDNFGYFLERELKGIIDDYELSGKVDGMIAMGVRSPKKPYFCLNEYKRQTDPDGEPQGQALIAMLIAQQENTVEMPIYGCYIIGRDWFFMVLEGKKYAVSKTFKADDEEVYEILRILKGLREIVMNHLKLGK
jgi:hypothetical protein